MYIPDIIPEEDRHRLIDKSAHGGSVSFGEEIAVLVVDMTRQFVEDDYPSGWAETGKPAARSIARLTETAGEHGVRSFYSRAVSGDSSVQRGRWIDKTGDSDLDPEASNLTDELSPTADDIVFEKAKPSVFFGTQLESMLNYSRVDTLIITGMTTSGCVRASVIDAFSYNYRVIIPEECVADRSQVSHEINLFDMDSKYATVRPLKDVIERLERR